MEKKYKKLYDDDFEKVSGGGEIFNEEGDECPLYGEHQWKQIEETTLEKCECGA